MASGCGAAPLEQTELLHQDQDAAQLRYGSLTVFVFIVFVSILRTMAAVPSLQHQNENGGDVPPTVTVLPSVSDCLHFLQFVFLTGGLSLSYPGFYPAAVGHLNWFALFADLALPIRSFVPAPIAGLVRMASTYPGVNDGLYEVNGTYGGYPGLEVMTQMVGAPMTCDTWLLMLCFIVSIAMMLGLFLWLLETLRPRNILGLPLLGHRDGTLAMRVGNGVLKLVLSHITLPLVALSTYQLNLSGSLGAGHITLTVVVLVLILLAFAWLAVRLPSESLGALVFEARLRYQRLGADGQDLEEGKQARREHGYVMVLFVLNIVRGLTIGGAAEVGCVAVCGSGGMRARNASGYPNLWVVFIAVSRLCNYPTKTGYSCMIRALYTPCVQDAKRKERLCLYCPISIRCRADRDLICTIMLASIPSCSTTSGH